VRDSYSLCYLGRRKPGAYVFRRLEHCLRESRSVNIYSSCTCKSPTECTDTANSRIGPVGHTFDLEPYGSRPTIQFKVKSVPNRPYFTVNEDVILAAVEKEPRRNSSRSVTKELERSQQRPLEVFHHDKAQSMLLLEKRIPLSRQSFSADVVLRTDTLNSTDIAVCRHVKHV
jgi:hypothetical protein